jgi:tape measure domain-containing protein
MASIDERILEMTFKGASLISGIQNTLSALKSLKEGLSGLKGSEKDINGLDEAGKKFSLHGMSQGIDDVTHHFSLMRIAGLTAFTSLVRQGLFAGEHLLASFTIDPIKAGLDSYETKINAIQTILANTSAAGTTLKQVTAALNQLNTYANKTVYNFGQMAKNIGTFTAAGVGLKTSVASIKGIANLAALSGSSAEQASTGMYQLSQSIAAGVVKLQDWNSVVNAGFGGKVFQKALIDTARVQGVSVDAMIKKYGSFRQSLQGGWLSAKVLTTTLAEFTGDLSKKQLEAIGFTSKESDAIQKQASIAVKSATQVRTVSGLFQDLKEEVATAWSNVFQAIIGNIGQATKTLSALHSVAESALTTPINNLAKLLQAFTDLGGRDIVIQAITTTFKALGAILHTVGQAFHDVFPSNGGSAAQGLIALAFHLLAFANALTPTKKTLEDFRTIFTGVFSAVKIVIDVIKALFGGLSQIGGATQSASGGFLDFVATLAHFITNLKNAIESGTALATFFRVLGEVLAFPIKLLGNITGLLGGFGGAAGKATSAVSGFVQKIGAVFSGLAGAIADGIKNGNFNAVIGIINQLLLGGVLLSIRKFIKGLTKGGGSGGGLFAGIKESFEALTSTLRTLQNSLKAGILEKIAIAVALLAASLLVLSLINIKDLTKALAAITVMFTELLTAMAVVTKVGGSAGIVKMEAIAVALNLLGSALLVLSGVVAILAQFSWEQLAKGLSAIAILLVELVGATTLMSTNSKGLIVSAVAMEIMAIALNTLALAVLQLGHLSLDSLVKGIGAIGVLLAILAGFNAISGVQLITTAAAMVLVGAALNVIALAVASLGKLSVQTLAKGLISIAAALGIIALAMNLMPPTMLVTSISLLAVAEALVFLSGALASMGGLSWTAIAKSLIELAGALAIIAAAMLLMTGALPGAAALLIVAASLAILTPVLIALGQLSWEEIGKGLATLAGVFVLLAAAGILLTAVVPTLLGLGAAIALLGIGILAAGAGVALFAVGLTALALAVTASGAAIVSFVGSILSLIPLALSKIGEGIVAFAGAISKGAVAIEAAFVAIISAVLGAIIKVAPKAAVAFGAVMTAILGSINKNSGPIINTFLNLILKLLNSLANHVPKFVTAAANLIVGMLNGIARQVPRMATAATNLIVAFINAIGRSVGRVVAAGINMVINLVNGIANKLRGSSPAIHSAAANLGSAIISAMVAAITGGIGSIVSAAVNMAKSALDAAKGFLGINSPSKAFHDQVGVGIPEGTALGIKDSTSLVTDQVETMGGAMLDALSKSLSSVNDVVGSNLDLQPRITPVIDLSQAQQGFSDLNKLSKSQLIAATGSTASALSISASQAAVAAAAAQNNPGGTNLTFNQNNYSPESLSDTTIYRKTKNQLSIAKGALSANSR